MASISRWNYFNSLDLKASLITRCFFSSEFAIRPCLNLGRGQNGILKVVYCRSDFLSSVRVNFLIHFLNSLHEQDFSGPSVSCQHGGGILTRYEMPPLFTSAHDV